MMKKWLMVALFCWSSLVTAADFDLEPIMKEMKLQFQVAADATSVDEMTMAMDKFETLVQRAQQGDYPPEKQPEFAQGFEHLQQAVDAVQVKLQSGDLQGAQALLRQMDDVRKEYHKKLRKKGGFLSLFG